MKQRYGKKAYKYRFKKGGGGTLAELCPLCVLWFIFGMKKKHLLFWPKTTKICKI